MWLTLFFFFNDTATTEIYTLSLHDALPILGREGASVAFVVRPHVIRRERVWLSLFAFGEERALPATIVARRSEERTSELQSQSNLVCRLLLEKKRTQGLSGSGQRLQQLYHA